MANVVRNTLSEAERTRTERMTVRDPRKVQLFSAATANGIKGVFGAKFRGVCGQKPQYLRIDS